MTWRDISRPVIAGVIARVGTSDAKKLRAALHEAYPFGLRQYYPYKIWCDEIRRQLGQKLPLGSRTKAVVRPLPEADPRQEALFS